MSVGCFDIATKTGWAVWMGPGVDDVLSGMVNCKPAEGEDPSQRLVLFWDFLECSHKEFNFHHLYYEKPGSFAGRGHANEVVPHLVGVFLLWAALHSIPVDWVSPSTLKKFATGRGNKIKKPEMMRAAQRYWPAVEVFDDNQADALILLKHAMCQHDYQPTN